MRDSQDPRAWDGRISNVIKYNQLVFQYWDISRIIPSISPSIIIPFVVLYDSIYYSTFHIFFNLNSTFFDLLNMYNIPSTIPCVIPFIISLFYSTYKSIYYDVNCSIYSISFTPFCDNSPRHEVRSSFSNEVKELAGLHQAVLGVTGPAILIGKMVISGYQWMVMLPLSLGVQPLWVQWVWALDNQINGG